MGVTIETYVAVLRDGPSGVGSTESVLCPFRPDGTPKPVLDHHGVIYCMVDADAAAGILEYLREHSD